MTNDIPPDPMLDDPQGKRFLDQVAPMLDDPQGKRFLDQVAQIDTIIAQIHAKHEQTADPMVELLDAVKAAVTGPRRKDYGDPELDLACTGALWSTWLNRRFGSSVKLTGSDVSVLMILLKTTRLANTPGHRDSLLDTAGYAATSYRCAVKGA